jgi:hypothetical protein
MWKNELLKKRKGRAFDKTKTQIITQNAENWGKTYEDFLRSLKPDKK